MKNMKQYQKMWRASNKDKIRNYRINWAKKHPDYFKAWKTNNKEKIKLYQQKYRTERLAQIEVKPQIKNIERGQPI